ncbi:hypothetical protein EKL97_14570 [Flavobacterium sp. LS1P28]|uniref:ParB/Sulfiredoxin domain-containing protein n=1 Tax=Flavobacterium bomense TaxID=2497483 RepID=A0A3S0UYD7_9FLAO|nr:MULTISPECIES: hypothetical protein [Flavobacterium]RTY78008.1 hypothetical protein EKL97_14570 [Flavobacterium sp. LS1P28]RTZ03608.1 hypothetical protein EKL98_11490 [Flavobacterium bomense]
MKKSDKIKWFQEPEEKDYPAAQSYLSLIFDEDKAIELVTQLKQASIIMYKAKDLFRASSLSLLGISNSHIEIDIEKIKKNKKISPLLLVRDAFNYKVIIADGYHRLCAVYTFNEDEIIPCKIV